MSIKGGGENREGVYGQIGFCVVEYRKCVRDGLADVYGKGCGDGWDLF